MRYQIQGDTLPVVICQLEAGERMITEGGGMSWMSPNMKMETTTNGGIGKAIGRLFSGEKNVLRREDVPEYLHCTGRQRNDRICFLLSRIDSCI